MPALTIQQAYDLAVQHLQAGRLREAEQLYRQILAQQPAHVEAMHDLGVIALQVGRNDVAAELIGRAIAARPDYVAAYNTLGVTLANRGRIDEAIAAYQQAIHLDVNLAEAHNNLGNALRDKGRLGEAIAAYAKVIALNPGFAEAYNNLGNARRDLSQYDEAIAAYRQAIALDPNYAEAHNNLGIALKDEGRIEEAIAAHRRAVELNPGLCASHSGLLYAMLFNPTCTAAEIAAEHRRWNRMFARPLLSAAPVFPQDRNPERRLRIGYVSPDFREHPVGRFMLPLIENHAGDDFEIFCYSDVRAPDSVTDRIRCRTAVWRNVVGSGDEAVAAFVRQDRIDILIDLAGHTDLNRLLVFARKPAPVQVTYLGHPATTGLTAIDYRLTDALSDPPGLTESHCTEQLIRLPQSAWCYQPPADAPPISALPAMQSGGLTFGSFNNFGKVNEPMLKCWAQILRNVLASRLLLKGRSLNCESVKNRVRRLMGEVGIGAERLELRGHVRADEHLALYGEVDIALDTYPYHGTTTTCEALWMGVPVVTLAGQSHVSRVGASLLTNVGLAEAIASSPEQYVQIATNLANDLPRLGMMRASLRQRMSESPLMDVPRFSRNVEAVYRQIWRTWCENNSAAG